MAKVDGPISSLIQGVSQQPARERLPGQCELQENLSSDPVSGLTRRGPLEHIRSLLSSPDDYTFGDYDAGSLGHFILAYKEDTIRVFNLDGTENTVVVEDSANDYIPARGLNFIGIDGNIYVVDPEKVVAMEDSSREYVEHAGLVFMLGGQYGRTYRIHVDWEVDNVPFSVTAEYTTPTGSNASHITNIATTYIINQLYNDFQAMGNTALQTLFNNFNTAIDLYQQYYSWRSCNVNGVIGQYTGATCSANKGQYNTGKANIATYGQDILNQLDTVDNVQLRAIVNAIMTSASGNVAIEESEQDTFNTHQSTYNAFISSQDFLNVFNIEKEDDVLFFSWIDPTREDDFEIRIEDGDGGTNMFAVNNTIKDVGELPRFAPQGYIVRVSESKSAAADDWYLEFLTTGDVEYEVGQGFGTEGVWIETVAPDVEYQIDADTMPHVLEKTGETEFTLKAGEWADRSVGDDVTNPLPSFIGHTISDVGAFQGRLTLLSDVNIIMSRTNKHTDFFNQSATTLADDDPIDISSALGTYILRKMVPHNRDLIIFSDQAQFIVFGRNVLTPRNSSLVLTTEFEADLTARPVAAGRNIFFAFEYGQYTGIHEFFTDGGEDVNDSRPITQHVLQYLRGTASQMTSTTNFNKLVVSTDDDAKVLYVYEYIWVNREKVQTSWSKWRLPREVEHTFFVDNLLYVICKQGSDFDVFTLDLDDTKDDGVDYRIMLDEKIRVDTVNTEFDVPYTIDDISNYVAVQGSGCPHPGMRVLIDSINGNTVNLKSDMNGGSVYFGKRYTSKYVPTSPFVRDRNNVKIGSGTLMIKQFTVHFDDTGYFRAEVTDKYGYSATVEYTGRVLGSPDNIVGESAVSSGSFSIPYKKNADNSQLEISTDSHLPMQLLEMEWSGQWRKKGKRITGG